ncbi:MAG: hypothetical protein ACTS6P_01610 [Candidatus Hodgkinia cicadicola]
MKTFNNKSKGHRNEMIIWVALNRATKRIVTTSSSHTIRIIYFERSVVGLIDLITAEGLFDWSISERMLHSKCLNKFNFIFNRRLDKILSFITTKCNLHCSFEIGEF